MSLLPRPNIQSLAMATHGSLDYGELERLNLRPEDVVDFSVNSNPFGSPPGVREAAARVAIDRYPDSEARELRRRLVAMHGVEIDSVLVGNGSVELIWSACLAYLASGDSALICGPTFGEYEVASRVAGADVIRADAREENAFRMDMGRILSLVSEHRPKAVFLCNPNNPTGAYLSREEVEEVLTACPDSLVVLDEAYVDFVRGHWSSVDIIARRNLLVLRSMTKDFAIAGLRLGYGMACPDIISSLRKARPPWSVNAAAQEAGIAALNHKGFVESCLGSILEARDYLMREFRRLGFPVVESRANFFLVKVGDARRFRADLLEKGLLVRDCASFGLPEYVRIAPRSMEECKRLVKGIEEIQPQRH